MIDSRTAKLLGNAAAFFALGEINKIHHFPGGLANQNYEVHTSRGVFVLKEILEHTYEETLLEVAYLQRVLEYDFPAPNYFQSTEGEFIYQASGRLVSAQQKIAGQPPIITDEVCQEVGRYLGLLHRIPFTGLPAKNHWLSQDYLPRLIKAIEECPSVYVKSATRSYEKLENLYSPRLPEVLMHSDISATNLLFNREKLEAILDWEEVGIGPATLDLGQAILALCLVVGGVDEKKYRAFMLSYLSQRELTTLEMESLAEAVRYTGLTNSAWRILRYSGQTSNGELDEVGDFYWYYKLDELELPRL